MKNIEYDEYDDAEDYTEDKEGKPFIYHKQSVGQRLVSKKFIALIIIVGISAVGLFLDKVTGQGFMELLGLFVPIYFGADAMQNIGISYSENRYKKSSDAKPRRARYEEDYRRPAMEDEEDITTSRRYADDVEDEVSEPVSHSRVLEPIVDDNKIPEERELSTVERFHDAAKKEPRSHGRAKLSPARPSDKGPIKNKRRVRLDPKHK